MSWRNYKVTARRVNFPLTGLIALCIPCCALSQPGLSQDQFADEFVRLTTTISGHGPNDAGSLVRWEHPVTWSLIGSSTLATGGPLKLDIPIRMQLSIKLALVQSQTQGRFKANYVEPIILRPPGYTAHETDWTINNISKAEVSFDLVQSPDGMVAARGRFEGEHFDASLSANLIVLYGQRTRLQRIKERLPSQNRDTFSMFGNGSDECSAFLWSDSRQGIGSAIIMIGDQMSWSSKEVCLSEAVGRTLGIRGDASGHIISVYSSDRSRPMGTSSGFDASVLKTLYDGELRSGMRGQEVAEVARRIARKYMPR